MVDCVRPGTSIEKYYNEPGFYRTFLPRPGMQECISKLFHEGHEIFIATSSPITGILDKIECYEEHFPEFSWSLGNIIPITSKHVLYGDLIVDDKMDNILESSCRHKFLMDAPWNQDFTYDGVLYTRVYGANDVYNGIQSLILSVT